MSVSMVDGHLFELLAALADSLRKKTDKPFGGIQVCPCCDICFIDPQVGIAGHHRRLFSITTCDEGHQAAVLHV